MDVQVLHVFDNFEVADYHTYFVGKLGVWVHNACVPNGDLAKEIGMLRAAAKGKGNYGLGSSTRAEADRIGKSWVGDGYKVASDGKTLISRDGLRQYRPPSSKPNSPYARTGTQANLERRNIPEGQWQGNGHIDIID